jgi:hypothetical protein
MKPLLNLKYCIALGVAASLMGCQTPPEALGTANNATKLMSLLDIQLKEFQKLQGAALNARKATLEYQKEKLLSSEVNTQLDIAASKSAGDTSREPLSKKLISDAQGVAEVRSKALGSKENYEQKLASILSPLPSTTAAITNAQEKMAVMGAELPKETRYSELMKFASEIKSNVDENKKIIKDAEKAATDEAAKVKTESVTE